MMTTANMVQLTAPHTTTGATQSAIEDLFKVFNTVCFFHSTLAGEEGLWTAGRPVPRSTLRLATSGFAFAAFARPA